MKRHLISITITVFLLIIGLTSCTQTIKDNDHLILFTDTTNDLYGYKNQKGDTVIPLGKYPICFTDTFKTYAIVLKPPLGFVAIDRQENILYQIFPFDNGPDYASNGLFRILENNKIGFADSITGRIVIKPQFDCAWPFENGIAKVSNSCKKQTKGEHSAWVSDNWYFIDKMGKKVAKPQTAN